MAGPRTPPSGHVVLLLPEKLLDPVDGVFTTVAEDVEGTGEDEVLILVGGPRPNHGR